jgi:tetratricopeptide (TPR) repeat protein
MWFDRLNSRIAADVGNSLADYFMAAATSMDDRRASRSAQRRKVIQSLLARVDSEARPLRLGMFRRAKLANSFKGRLLNGGADPTLADELAQMLLLRLSEDAAETADAGPEAPHDLLPENRPGPGAGSVGALLAQAEAAVARGDHIEVIDRYQALLKLKPRHLLARNNLGVALWKVGRYQDAVEQLRRAAGIQPTYADAQFNLGTLLRLTGQVAESEMPLRRAVKLNPKRDDAQVSLGLTLIMLGRLHDARECFEKALKITPRHAGAATGLGKVASLEGRFEEAETHYKDALAVDANLTTAWASLAQLRKMTPADAAWVKNAEKIAASGIGPLEEADLRFAIGKYWDDTGDFERAFRSYQRANELQKAVAERYDTDARVRFVDDTIRAYTREAITANEAGRSESVKPVFVVGMMRSGTSLVEQIIAAHPAVHGAGELQYWSDAARKHEGLVRNRLPGESLMKKLAQGYLSELDGRSSSAQRVVDKSTYNSDHLGLIHSVLPNARMIYVQRDPIDTCLSCYFTQLSSAHNFTWDLADLAHYYREHQRLVAHWRSVLPAGTLLDVPYAELVEDQERWTRKILDFIGLEWDESCLKFHTAERPVMTASFWQVRQKMYNRSVGRWRRYEKYIGPLRELREKA